MNDGRFEVIGLRSLHDINRMKVDPSAHGMRICQGRSLQLKLKSESTPFQVDGEPWVQLGGTVTLTRGNAVGVLPGPHFNHSSRKNASFFDGDRNGESGDDQVAVPSRAVDDINIGSPRNGDVEKRAGAEVGPGIGSVRPPASFS